MIWGAVVTVIWDSGGMAQESGGRAASLIYTCQARGHGFNFRYFPQIKDCMDNIHACLIKQPNSTLSRMYVQTYIRIK